MEEVTKQDEMQGGQDAQAQGGNPFGVSEENMESSQEQPTMEQQPQEVSQQETMTEEQPAQEMPQEEKVEQMEEEVPVEEKKGFFAKLFGK